MRNARKERPARAQVRLWLRVSVLHEPRFNSNILVWFTGRRDWQMLVEHPSRQVPWLLSVARARSPAAVSCS
jgi:hypothetical protein